jgi:hypothetical protein
MARTKRIVRYESLDAIPKPKRIARRMPERAITAAMESDPDAAPVVDRAWFKRAKLIVPQPGTPLRRHGRA